MRQAELIKSRRSLGAGSRDPDDGPHHPRGEGHAGQDPCAGRKAIRPKPGDPSIPWSRRCASTGFDRRGEVLRSRARRQGRQRSPRLPLRPRRRWVKLAETCRPRSGADEIDMVIDRARS